ncbi:MAG: ABC transporter substrate-binding protein [Actinobacteria bacterium]|nr:ABC transporter substrate-binding protein [Actinomycetota bacterium]
MKKSATRAVLAVLLALTLVAAACGDDDGQVTTTGAETTTTGAETTTTAAGVTPVKVGELAYYTGDFGAYGASLTNDVAFPINQVINLDPPLGRPWVLISEDLGTVGEAQAARKLVEEAGVEILVSQAHGYRNYRAWMNEWVAEHDGPLGPTVHGGSIPGNIGGTAAEPLFRAQGLDEGLGTYGVLYAEALGAESIVIFATEVEGFQLAADAAGKAAEAIGMEVLRRFNVPSLGDSYLTEAQAIADLAPDAIIVQAGSLESGTLIRQYAEAGLPATTWIGESGWGQPEFMETMSVPVVATQEFIGFAGVGYNDDSPAWAAFEPLWESVPGNVDTFGPANDLYHYSTYDLIIITALAVEQGGSYKASDWAPAMYEVTAGGEVCYTYADCLAMIREGKDIDYEGVTGPGDFTPGGVNAVTPVVFPYNADGTVGDFIIVDPLRVLEILDQIKVEAGEDWG